MRSGKKKILNEEKLFEIFEKTLELQKGYNAINEENNKLFGKNMELEKEVKILKERLQVVMEKLNQANKKYKRSTANEKRLKERCAEIEKNIPLNYIKSLEEIENKVKKSYEDYTKLQNENIKIINEKNEIKNKYQSLSTSKLGKLTLKYWKIRGKGNKYAK